MIKLLIIEDDLYKSNAISEYLRDELNINNITCRESLSSGVFEVLDNPNYDLILLDMSMSTYDISDKDPVGGIPESFAGEDFLAQMDLLGYKIPILVVTQYDTFGAGDDSFPLKILDKKLSKKHPEIYKGSIFFRSISNEWKILLKEKLYEVLN
jgi:CheY-like chemotaxis protein